MECTQRLQCTQEIYETHTERVCPEQIGFLGICGAKHPVLRGPNKVGRDPHTCNIVLNLNSISRQHAVINVLSSKEFMLMDLDSANKTKLLNKTLQPYIPHPIKDGDTVQFGDIFGIFRLVEENDELPMTQAIDIPETPLPSRHVSKLTKAPTTVIPESPDVSDKDESFVTPTHSRNVTTTRLSSSQFIKPFGKSISIQPVSTPKSDTSCNSSKRPLSFENKANNSLDESNTSDKNDIHEMDTQTPFPITKPKNDIHEMDTQAPLPITKPKNDIHEMDTQAPYPITKPTVNDSTDSIYMADTQAPPGHAVSPSIHSLDTQIPTIDHLPQVRKISDQKDMHIDIYAANKENDLSIFNAETQPLVCEKSKLLDIVKISDVSPKTASKSEEELLFDEIEDECLEDFNSQPLLPLESPKHELSSPKASTKVQTVVDSDGSTDCEDIDMAPTQKVEELPVKAKLVKKEFKPTVSKGNKRIESDDSTDCEDIECMPTQKIAVLLEVKESKEDKGKVKHSAKRGNRIHSDSSTDCEEIDTIPTQKILEKKDNKEDDLTDCEDDFIEITSKKPKTVEVTDFEDMPTQVIDIDPDKIDKPDLHNMDTQIVDIVENAVTKSVNDVDFEDQPTQIIDEIVPNNSEIAKKPLLKPVSPFKIPLQSPIRVKSREILKVPKAKIPDIITVDDDNYYNATQDILDDLCTQRDGSPILGIVIKGSNSPITIDDDVVPCSVEDYKVAEKFANIDRELLSPTFRDQRVKKHAANLSSQEVRDVIGVDPIAKLRKMPSDCSDLESTPKKVRSILFTDSDLPNSQEIKTSMHIQYSKPCATDSSSESEPEQNSEYSQEVTPFVHRKKKLNPVAKIDLTKKFDAEKLPERIITRVRKPTSKVEENLRMAKKVTANILKPKYLTEQEDQIDQDIITENVKRLKTYERAKSNKETKSENKTIDAKSEIKINEREIENKADIQEDKRTENKQETENKKKEPKEKIKVKIEKPKKKESNSKSKNKDEITIRKSKEETTRKSREKTHKESTNKDDERNKSKESLTTDDKVKTRSRRRKEDESKSITPESKKEDSRKKRPSRKKEPVKESISPEVEVRRSKRQAKVKENKSDSQTVQPIQPKSILKKSIHEQSTVYNESTSSGASPKNLKRSLVDDGEVPSPKRTRAFVNNVNNSMNNVSLRATPARTMKTQYVLFTAFPSEEVKHKLEKLGAVIVTDVMQCSVVLTMQVKRTFKLLCAVGLGRPIVGPGWVQACVDTHMVVDPWLYLIKDEPAEKRFRFCLDRTLNGKRNFLKGYNVSSTPSVQPNASEMRLIVECSGGVWKESGPNWVCVSSTKDQALWPQLRKRGAVIVSTEFILGGVLRQQLDIISNKFP